MRLHEISVRDPIHERDAALQSAEIAKWIAAHHPTVTVEVLRDQYGRYVVTARCPEHGMAHEIRYEVATIFPSRPIDGNRIPEALVPREKPVKHKAKAPSATTGLHCPGLYVVHGDWKGHGDLGKTYPGIRAATKALKASKAEPGAHAHVVEVTKKGTIRKLETWTKARVLWHKGS